MGLPIEEATDRDCAEGRQRSGRDKHQKDQRERLGTHRERTAAGAGHGPCVPDGEQEGGRTTAADRRPGADDDAWRGFGGDRGHDPVLEALGGADAVDRRQPFELARGRQQLGGLGGGGLGLAGGSELGGIEPSTRPAHASLRGSTVPRNSRRPRRRCVLTVASGRSVWRVISSSESSPKKRKPTTSR